MNIWQALMAPALSGQRARVRSRLHILSAGCAPSDRPHLAAVAARALLTVGDAEAAVPWLDEALEANDIEGMALARVIYPDGPSRCAAQLRRLPPGPAADAGCDLAWHRARQGNLIGARAAARQALRACPGHNEARQWLVLLESPRPGDADRMYPTRTQGWLSIARLHRRPRGHHLQPAPGALGWLQEVGVVSFQLASRKDYTRQAPGSPLAMLEADLSLARALLRSGRPAEPLLMASWRRLLQQELPDIRPAAQAIVRLALRAGTGSATGIAAAEVLTLTDPASVRWQAALARLLAEAGEERAIQAARVVLSSKTLCAESWSLAQSALQLLGQQREASAIAMDALHLAPLRAAALEVLSEG